MEELEADINTLRNTVHLIITPDNKIQFPYNYRGAIDIIEGRIQIINPTNFTDASLRWMYIRIEKLYKNWIRFNRLPTEDKITLNYNKTKIFNQLIINQKPSFIILNSDMPTISQLGFRRRNIYN